MVYVSWLSWGGVAENSGEWHSASLDMFPTALASQEFSMVGYPTLGPIVRSTEQMQKGLKTPLSPTVSLRIHSLGQGGEPVVSPHVALLVLKCKPLTEFKYY